MAEQGLSVFQVMRVAGVTNHQLRYWAQSALVVPSIRDSGGRPGRSRRYSEKDLERVIEIRGRLGEGESLQQIRKDLGAHRRLKDRVDQIERRPPVHRIKGPLLPDVKGRYWARCACGFHVGPLPTGQEIETVVDLLMAHAYREG